MPRGASSGDDVAMEKMTTGASCPWNLSTVPTRRPGQPRQHGVDLRVVGTDDEHVAAAEGARRALRIDPVDTALRERAQDPADAFDFLGRGVLVPVVLHGYEPQSRALVGAVPHQGLPLEAGARPGDPRKTAPT